MSEEITTMTSVGKTSCGGFVITKEYSDGVIEQVLIKDCEELETLVDEMTDLLKGRKCPKCGEIMSVALVKEYTCDDCQLVLPESVLDAMERDE